MPGEPLSSVIPSKVYALVSEAANGRLAIFAGAGLSVGSAIPKGPELAKLVHDEFASSVQGYVCTAPSDLQAVASAAADLPAGLQMLAPFVGEIYSRLDPHPAFTRLEYALGLHYQRPVADAVVVDETSDVSADPLLVFSSSQANIVALTFFLAMSWTAGSHSLPFLLLDDPLQAMDDINALGFADLCRHIRGRRQLVISTHDRRLGSLLERKLAPRIEGERTCVLRFEGWDRSGPQIEQQFVEPQYEAAARRTLLDAA